MIYRHLYKRFQHLHLYKRFQHIHLYLYSIYIYNHKYILVHIGEKVAHSDGIIYLGACPKTCYKYSAVHIHGRQYIKCWGHCAHAFGITKWKTYSFPNLLRTITYDSSTCKADGKGFHNRCYFFDTALRDYGQLVSGGIYLVNSHLILEQTDGTAMKGMFFQDRDKFKSSIGR